MKKICLAGYMCFLFLTAYSQDIIYLKGGEKLNAKVLEVKPDSIKYTLNDDADGILRSIAPYDIFLIRYENGSEVIFNVDKPKAEKYFSEKKNSYYSIAGGWGQSYGGFGFRFQGRTGKKIGFGYHAGIGYSVNDATGLPDGVLVAAGLKFFWYKAWYVNLQYGPVLDYIVLDDNRMVIETGRAWGPTLLIGGDWFFNESFGMNGAMGRSLNITKPEAEKVELPRFDIGFIYKF